MIASLGQQALRRGDVGFCVSGRAGFGRIGTVADEVGVAGVPPFRIAEARRQDVTLVRQIRQCQARAGIVERRLHGVGPQQHLVRHPDELLHPHGRILCKLRHQIKRRLLDEIDLALLKRIHRRRSIGNDVPLHAVHLHHAAAGKPVRRFVPRYVVRILLEHHAVAADRRTGVVAERTGADCRRQRLAGIVALQVFRPHDERNLADCGAEREQHIADRLLELQRETPIIHGIEAGGRGAELVADDVLLHPAPQRGDHVGAGDGRTVVEFEAAAQREAPGELVGRGGPCVHHLRPGLEVLVPGEQLLVHHHAEDARDDDRREHGVEAGKIGAGDNFEHLGLSVRRCARCGQRQRRQSRDQGRTEPMPCHGVRPRRMLRVQCSTGGDGRQGGEAKADQRCKSARAGKGGRALLAQRGQTLLRLRPGEAQELECQRGIEARPRLPQPVVERVLGPADR